MLLTSSYLSVASMAGWLPLSMSRFKDGLGSAFPALFLAYEMLEKAVFRHLRI